MTNDRIEQCRANITKLREELARLEKESQRRIARHGDVVRMMGDRRDLRFILKDSYPNRMVAYDVVGEIRAVGGRNDSEVQYLYDDGAYVYIGNVFEDYMPKAGGVDV